MSEGPPAASSALTISELNARHGIPGVAAVVIGRGGLPMVRITGREADGQMYLYGAQITSWRPRAAHEVLFVSARARWEHGRPIRGGVPVCFPWFGAKLGDAAAPAHGFARTMTWQLESIKNDAGAVTVSMMLASDATTKRWWPAEFRLRHRARFGETLTMELRLTNTGDAPLRFEESLHAYLRVGMVQKIRLRGLDGLSYLDNTDSNWERVQQGAVVITSATDRVYLNTAGPIDAEDPVLKREIRVAKRNSLATVVWNPWATTAPALDDLGAGEWERMVCVECANVGAHAVDVAPGARHTMTAEVSVSEKDFRG